MKIPGNVTKLSLFKNCDLKDYLKLSKLIEGGKVNNMRQINKARKFFNLPPVELVYGMDAIIGGVK